MEADRCREHQQVMFTNLPAHVPSTQLASDVITGIKGTSGFVGIVTTILLESSPRMRSALFTTKSKEEVRTMLGWSGKKYPPEDPQGRLINVRTELWHMDHESIFIELFKLFERKSYRETYMGSAGDNKRREPRKNQKIGAAANHTGATESQGAGKAAGTDPGPEVTKWTYCCQIRRP